MCCLQRRIRFKIVYRPNQTCTTTLPLMGRGIIDYLVRASMDARITSDGSDVVTHGTESCLDRRPRLFSKGTGNTVGTPMHVRCGEYGSMAPPN